MNQAPDRGSSLARPDLPAPAEQQAGPGRLQPVLATLRRLLRSLPTALVLAALAGLAYWGHHTGYFGGPTADRAAQPADGNAPEVAPAGRPGRCYGWCSEHGVHDCPLHHPDVAQVSKPVAVTPEDFDRARRALAVRPRPENDAECLRQPCGLRFASAEAVEKARIEIAPAWRSPVTEAIGASGEVSFDPTRLARLSARAPGTASYVACKIGDPVRAGELLALIDAAEVGKAKSEFLQALVQARLKRAALENVKAVARNVAERQLREAEAAHRDAEARLLASEQALVNLGLPVRAADFPNVPIEEIAERIRLAGLPEELTRDLDPKTATANLLPVRAPFDAVVLTSDVVAGEVVDPGKVLFVVVDPRRVWLRLNVGLDDVRHVAAGLPVTFRQDGTSQALTGKVAWVGTASDERTRTVPVRVELANEAGRLRASAFGTGRILLREEPGAVVVPNEAVHADRGCQFVFVRHRDFLKPDGPKEFITRTVRTGAKEGPNTEIIVGVLPGEVVASKGSGLLLNELNRLTAAGPAGRLPRGDDAAARQGRTP
jgi:membrane fusion protein, heavy metal efflux system